ncbi:hypothetical protein Ahy_A02g009476 [Arachis hypogaea]|uniref:Uncharacterized protein n=1 Tax=Arachis hypogaea TaxID=3818 RepID=A0A445EH40_ARAHY|nr:hypothetical protein Ahy_A02g009476 [Arachis hypogaea]
MDIYAGVLLIVELVYELDSLTKCIDLMQEMVMWTEANRSTIDTSFLSMKTPVSVLERSIKRPKLAGDDLDSSF